MKTICWNFIKVLLVIFLIQISTANFTFATNCQPEFLEPKVLELVRPILEEGAEARKVGGLSQHHKNYWRLIDELTINRSNEADKALVYFLNLYMGEHWGGEILCTVINRGKRLLPMITQYQECLPKTGLEPLDISFEGSGYLPKDAIEGITKGEYSICHISDLKLNALKSISVVGGLSTPSDISISFDSIADKFEKVITSTGVTLDKSIHDNVVSVGVYIDKVNVKEGIDVYTVNIESQYTEVCVAKRLNLKSSCVLWEKSKGQKVFNDPKKVEEYVEKTIIEWADSFSEAFK